MTIQQLAERIDSAALNAQAVEQLSKSQTFNVDESYAIQKASIERRYDRGEQFIGVKMGFTSKAKMEQMGVHDMIWGRLTDKMRFENGEITDFKKYIHPRAEPEICFRVSQTIDRAISLDEVKNYIDGIAAAIEIIDSRYQNFKFSLEDVIADNCSSSGLVIGGWHNIDIPLGDLKMNLIIDGEVVQSGSSAAILGNPWESVVAAARLGVKYGQVLPAGSVIMAGAATSAVYLKPGNEVKTNVEALGEVAFSIQ
jgi:2-oxo-3-hexenedioate decarboxylase